MAAADPRNAVGSLPLVALLGARPDVGDARAKKIVAAVIVATSSRPVPWRRATVRWLLDARCGRRRYAALVEALVGRGAPWEGFPYTPAPEGVSWS